MLAMRLQKSLTVMAPRQQLQLQQHRQRHPVGVLHAALLLLCLALLIRDSATSADARPLPSEDDTEYVSSPAKQPKEGTPSQQISPVDMAVLPNSDADEDNLKDCAALPDSTSEPCVSAIDGRILVADYGPPGGNQDSRPAGPIP